MNLLFVTWDGPSTTYHESLFIPLLSGATGPRDDVHLLHFTWGDSERADRIRTRAAGAGIGCRIVSWQDQPPPSRLPALVARRAALVANIVRANNIDVVMARSIIPAAMVMAARGRFSAATSFVYDADGLMADERADFGGWKRSGFRYRALTTVERRAVRRAEAVVVRTHQAAEILSERANVPLHQFHVVTNGKDSEVFSPGTEASRSVIRSQLGIPADAPIIAYVGSLGPQYQLSEMVNIFVGARRMRPDTRLLLLTPRCNHSKVHAAMPSDAADSMVLLEAEPEAVPRYLAVADIGLSLRTPSLSQSAVAPIKVSEYLLAGVPVAYTRGVGDLGRRLPSDVGHVHESSEGTASFLLDDVLPTREAFRSTSRAVGVREFSLERGINDYRLAFGTLSPRRL